MIIDAPTNEIVIAQEGGIIVEYSKSYGIGIDCHSKFIQVSVLVKRSDHYYEYRHEFGTDWPSLVSSKEWAVAVLNQCADPPIEDLSSIHYCIESTAVYHYPVLMAWEGTPSIVNPSIAGSTKRKTDVLDAKLLATHDLTGVWKQSFVPSSEVQQLRALVSERESFQRLAGMVSNRMNSTIIKFGITISREGSIARNKQIRKIVEDLISDNPSQYDAIFPDGIPEDVKPVIKQDYEMFDWYRRQVIDYENKCVEKVKSMTWETRDSTLSGADMLRILTSAPGIGAWTACLWLSYIITPRRFPSSKALAAYCGLDPSLKISAGHVTSTVKRGGNKALHSMLQQAGSRLVKDHREMFGQWGYSMYLYHGRWKKSANAVARKLAVALYHMMLTGQSFTYDKYKLLTEQEVIDISIDELAAINHDFKRYIKYLKESDITTTSELAKKYYSYDLQRIKGLGHKFLVLTREFVTDQSKYKKLYNAYKEGTV